MRNRDLWEHEDLPVELLRLRQLIASELHAQFTLRAKIPFEDIPEVADAVAYRLEQAFRVQWAPVWEQDRGEDDESLGPDSAVFYGSRAPSDRFPIFDHDWP
jgi:hypothetical protein